jgi:hypothetical protein
MATSLQYVMDQCKLHTKLQNFFAVGGVSGEPGCGIGNRVMQMLLQKRMAWKFNRQELGPPNTAGGNFFVTQQGFQDIRHAGASAFVLLNNQSGGGTLPTGGVSIDLAAGISFNNVPYPPINGSLGGLTQSGTTITIQTIDPHPFQSGNIGQSVIYISGATVPAYNSLYTWNQLTQLGQWTNGYLIIGLPDQYHIQVQAQVSQVALAASGAPGIWNLGWLESASIQDINSLSFPQGIWPIEAVHRVSPEYTTTGEEPTVCALIDYGNGVIKFRLSQPWGTQCVQVNIIYQARAAKLTSPQSVFQWPDDLSYVLVEMCLWQASRFAYGGSAEETMKFEQSAMAAVQSALEGEDREANDQALTPIRSFM